MSLSYQDCGISHLLELTMSVFATLVTESVTEFQTMALKAASQISSATKRPPLARRPELRDG